MDETIATIIGWELYVMTGVTGACAAFLATWIHRVDRSRHDLAERVHSIAAGMKDAAGASEIARLEKALASYRLCVAEHYVRRDDYVHQMSIVGVKLDGIGERQSSQQAMLERLDERSQRWEER